MKKWILTASTDGNLIDWETVIESDTEPDFWTCYDLAAAHGCDFFTINETKQTTPPGQPGRLFLCHSSGARGRNFAESL